MKLERWIKLYGKILDDEVFQNEKLLKVFIWCLLKATYKEHKQIVGLTQVMLEKGQFVTGRSKAALELNMKESTVWKLLKLLEQMKIIKIKSNNKFSIVTIEKWEVYQHTEEKSNNKRTSKEQQNNTNKKEKKEKNNIYAQQVEQLWTLYPNKQGKATAIKKIPKLIEKYGYEKIESCIKRYASEVQGRDKKYIKHGSTFFNSGYMDYLDENTGNPSSNTRELYFDQYSDMYYYLDGENRVYVDKEE